MSLETLLEAARYIELQELKEQQNRRLDGVNNTSPVSDGPRNSMTTSATALKPQQGVVTEVTSFKRDGIGGGVSAGVLSQFGLKQGDYFFIF